MLIIIISIILSLASADEQTSATTMSSTAMTLTTVSTAAMTSSEEFTFQTVDVGTSSEEFTTRTVDRQTSSDEVTSGLQTTPATTTLGINSMEQGLFVGHSLAGLVVKASTSGAEDPWFESRLRRDFSGWSYTSDFKLGTPVATLPGAWHFRVSAGTGRPGVSIL